MKISHIRSAIDSKKQATIKMPTQYPAMINFYMIRHPDEPKFRYVGSTAHSIEDRLKRHKADMLRGKNCRSAVILKRYPDAQIEIVDERMCNDIAQRNKIEGSLIKCFKSVNHIICGRTPIQYEKYRKPKRDGREDCEASYMPVWGGSV